MKLSEIKSGKCVKIISINCNMTIKTRLKSLGIVPNTIVNVVNIAPFGTPIEIKSDNLRFAISKAEANKITVEYVK